MSPENKQGFLKKNIGIKMTNLKKSHSTRSFHSNVQSALNYCANLKIRKSKMAHDGENLETLSEEVNTILSYIIISQKKQKILISQLQAQVKKIGLKGRRKVEIILLTHLIS